MRSLSALILISLLSCSPRDSSQQKGSDTASAITDTINTLISESTTIEAAIEKAKPLENLTGIDTLYNLLARKGILQGSFGDVELITTSLLNIAKLEGQSGTYAILIHTGEGEGYETRFQTLYSVLAAFEQSGDQLRLLDYVDLGEVTSYGLRQNTTEGDSIMLADKQAAAVIHFKGSEEGAGDSGYRSDVGQFFILVDNKLANVFEVTFEDFSFSSNESDSYYEQTTTNTLTVLDEAFNGLFKLKIESDTQSKGFSGEDASTEVTAQEPEEDPSGTYAWNGTTYEKEN